MKKFAKLMSVVLAIAMLFAMAIPVASIAAEGGKLAIVIETVEANAGDAEVEVKLFIPAEPHWSAMDITFNFDPTKLTFVEEGFEVNDAVAKQLSGGKPSIFALNEEKAAEGEVLIAFASSVTDGGYEGYYNVDKKGNVYDYFGTFLFDVADGATGLQEITATVGKLVHTVDDKSVDVEYTLTKGGIKLPEPPKPVVVEGIEDGAEINLYDQTAPAPTWTPESATATLNGAPYTAGTPISEVGEYELVVTGDIDSKTVNFSVVNEEPPFDGIDIVIEKVAAKAGDADVEVKLFIPAEPHWSAIDITFKFDPTKLTFVEEGFEVNDAIAKQLSGGKPSIFALNEEKAAEGEVLIAFASSVTDGGYEGYYNVDKKGNVYDYFGTFLFDVADGLEDGLYEITATVGKLVHTVDDESVDVEYNLTSGGIEIASCQHEWAETGRTPATCEEDGAIHYVCSKDQSHTKDEVIPKLGHDWGEWEETTPATCMSAGEKTRTCQREGCGETDTDEIPLDPDAHTWGEWEVKVPATCEAAGLEARVCLNNDIHIDTRPIDALDHDWSEWQVDEPATCTTAGQKSRYCLRDGCNEFDYDEIPIDPEAHNWDEWEVTTPATCTTAGEKTRVCLNDGDHTETETIEPLDHDWGDWQVTTPATCDDDGEETRYCQRMGCDEFETRVITKLGHDYEETERVPATCEEDGYVEYVCKNDPTHTYRDTLTALDHEWSEWEVVIPATCTTPGGQTRHCKRDGCTKVENQQLPIDPDAHTWGEWEVTTPATCTEKGVETRVCKNNPAHTETRDIAPIDHAWGEWEVTKAATYEAEGVETRVCKNDPEHIETRVIPKLVKPDDGGNTKTSDNGIAVVAVVALIASAAVVVFSRKKRLAK